MVDKQYVYAVARIRSKELSLLSGAFLERLIAAKSYDECVRLLTEKGWRDDNTKDVEAILAAKRRRVWGLISGPVKNISVFNAFLYANDYHNLKVAIKEVRTGHEYLGIYIDQGTADVELMHDAIESREFQNLPETMRVSAGEVHKTLLRTQDGQLCDTITDRATLEATYHAGKPSSDEFLRPYAELMVAAADMKTTVRASYTGKDGTLLEQALAPCDTLDTVRLTQAAIEGVDATGIYLESAAYADAVEELYHSPLAFKRRCDNLMICKIKPQQYSPLGFGPLAAHILTRENEIKSVRIVFSGKLNYLPEEPARERVKEMYV